MSKIGLRAWYYVRSRVGPAPTALGQVHSPRILSLALFAPQSSALAPIARGLAHAQSMSSKDLVTRALERELAGFASNDLSGSKPIHVLDEDGLPCLPRRGVVVADSLVNQLREEQGV